jgi:hypothetical protein
MKGEIYYREKFPKELRIQIQNKEELEFLKFLFSFTPRGILKKFTRSDLENEGLSDKWKKDFSDKSDRSNVGEPFSTYEIWEVLDEEENNVAKLEDASYV